MCRQAFHPGSSPSTTRSRADGLASLCYSFRCATTVKIEWCGSNAPGTDECQWHQLHSLLSLTVKMGGRNSIAYLSGASRPILSQEPTRFQRISTLIVAESLKVLVCFCVTPAIARGLVLQSSRLRDEAISFITSYNSFRLLFRRKTYQDSSMKPQNTLANLYQTAMSIQ